MLDLRLEPSDSCPEKSLGLSRKGCQSTEPKTPPPVGAGGQARPPGALCPVAGMGQVNWPVSPLTWRLLPSDRGRPSSAAALPSGPARPGAGPPGSPPCLQGARWSVSVWDLQMCDVWPKATPATYSGMQVTWPSALWPKAVTPRARDRARDLRPGRTGSGSPRPLPLRPPCPRGPCAPWPWGWGTALGEESPAKISLHIFFKKLGCLLQNAADTHE